jgi:hypothetical protein
MYKYQLLRDIDPFILDLLGGRWLCHRDEPLCPKTVAKHPE